MVSYLSIGGITMALRVEEPMTWTWVEPMSRFLVRPVDEPEVELAVVIGSAGDRVAATPMFDPDAVWRLYQERAGYRIECHSAALGEMPYKTAIFNEEFTKGTIFVQPHVTHLHPLDYPLDEVLVASLLGRGRGVELHSCGIIDRRDRGHLFVGVSGAGKSTTADLWEHAASSVLSDDRVIVRERDGEMQMFGTPWHGEAERSIPANVPIAGVYLIVQSEKNSLRTLEPAEAVARLFQCTFPLFHDSKALDFTIGFLARLVATVPVRELQFNLDGSVVDLVSAA